jgi:chitinase
MLIAAAGTALLAVTCSAAAWSSSTAYTSGDVVSYNGDQWTANQWNYDEVPGGASGAWTSDGAC